MRYVTREKFLPVNSRGQKVSHVHTGDPQADRSRQETVGYRHIHHSRCSGGCSSTNRYTISRVRAYPHLGRLDAFIFLDLRPSSLHSGAGLMPASLWRLPGSPTIASRRGVSNACAAGVRVTGTCCVEAAKQTCPRLYAHGVGRTAAEGLYVLAGREARRAGVRVPPLSRNGTSCSDGGASWRIASPWLSVASTPRRRKSLRARFSF